MSESSDEFAEEDYVRPAVEKKKPAAKEKPAATAVPSTPTAMPLKKRKATDDAPGAEDGEIGSSKGAADEESSEIEPFNDGYDSDLMGDEQDRVKYASLLNRTFKFSYCKY